MSLQPIAEGLPSDLTMQLMSQEQVFYFSYIAFKGGCGSSASRSNYWIAVTNKRVLYKAKINEDNKSVFVEKDGVLPLEKVSFMEVAEKSSSAGCGCSSAKAFHLTIGTSGGTVSIPVPTKDKCHEIIRVYSEITQG